MISTTQSALGTGSLQISASKNQFVSLSPLSPIGTNGVSFSVWFNSNNSANYAIVFDLTDPNNTMPIVMYISDTNLALYLVVNGRSYNTIVANNVNNGTWVHAVWTLDPSGNCKVYINGTLNFTGVYAYPNPTTPFTRNSLGKSLITDATNPYFNGYIDEFRVYNRVLTQTDVTNLYMNNSLVLNYGMLLFYHCDTQDYTSNLIYNYSNNLYNSLVGSPSLSSDYMVGDHSLSLNYAAGSSSPQYIVPPSVNFASTSGFTVCMWVKTSYPSNGNKTTFFNFTTGSGADNSTQFAMDSSSFIETTNGVTTTTAFSSPNSNWHHIAIVFGNTTTRKLYVDGVLCLSYTGTPYSSNANGSGCAIGYGWNASDTFVGLIDDVRLYNKILDQNDILTVFGNNVYTYTVGQLKLYGYTAIQLRNSFYSDSDVISAGYSASELNNAGYTAVQLLDSGLGLYTDLVILAAGFSASQLRTAGYTSTQLYSAGYTASQLREGGYQATDAKAGGYSDAEILIAGFSATQLKSAGYSATQLYTASYTASQLYAAGYTAGNLHTSGFTMSQIRLGGYLLSDMQSNGYSLSEIMLAGYSSTIMKASGYTAAQMCAGGYSVADLQAAGYTIGQIILAGYTAQVLRIGGYQISDMVFWGLTNSIILNAGFSATDLKTAGFTATQLYGAGYTASQLYVAGYTIQSLQAAGYFASVISAAGYTATQLKAAGYAANSISNIFTIAQLQTAGYTLANITSAGYSSALLQAAGYTIPQLKAAVPPYSDSAILVAGYSATVLVSNGYNASQLCANGYTIAQLKATVLTTANILAAGYTADLLFGAGYTAVQLLGAGYTASQCKAGGFSDSSILSAGFTASSLYLAGYSTSQLLANGYTASQARAGGYIDAAILSAGFPASQMLSLYTASQMCVAGYTPQSLVAAGYTNANILQAGYSASALNAAGFTAAQLSLYGYTPAQLKAGGYSDSIILSGGFTASTLLSAGYSAAQLISAGYTALQLKNAGFSDADLLSAGYTSTQLKSIGFSAIQLYGAGYSIAQLQTANYLSSQIISAGYTAALLKAAGYTASQMQSTFTSRQLQVAGYSDANILAGGYSAANLLAASYTASQLFSAAYSVSQLKSGGYSDANILAAGYTITQLLAAGYTNVQVAAAGYTIAQFVSAGCSKSVILTAGFSADLLKSAGYTARDLQLSGYSVSNEQGAGYLDADILASGYSAASLLSGGYSAANLFAAGYTASSLKTGGFADADILVCGYTIAQLKSAGYLPTDLQGAGYTNADILAAGYSSTQLFAANYTASQLYAANYTAGNLRSGGYQDSDILGVGYTALQLKQAGYVASDLFAASYTAIQLFDAGFAVIELQDSGYSDADILSAGYLAVLLKNAGYSSSDLKSAGYTALQLKNAGYTDADILSIGYDANSLSVAGYTVEQLRVYGYSDGELLTALAFVTEIAPQPITLVSATPGSSSAIIELTDTNVVAIVGYKYSLDGINYLWCSTKSSPVTITGLTNGTSYTIQMVALSSGGQSEASNSLTVTPGDAPGAPYISSIVASDSSLLVSFIEGVDNGTPVSNYYYNLNGGNDVDVSADVSDNQFTISGLTNGTSYSVRMKTANTFGKSPASYPSSGKPVDSPEAPVITDIIPGNGTASVEFNLGSSNGGNVLFCGYTLDGGDNYLYTINTSSPMLITGLTNGYEYNVAIKSVNSIGQSQISNTMSVIPTTNPTAPVIIGLTPNQDTLTIQLIPSNPNGADSVDYYYSLNGGAYVLSDPPVNNSITLYNLTTGLNYTVALKSRNSSGYSVPSNSYTSLLQQLPPVPIITSVVSSDSSVSVYFSTSAVSNASDIICYQYALNGDDTHLYYANNTTSPIVIYGLTNNTNYKVKLKGLTGIGATGFSLESPVFTPYSYPDAPNILSVLPGNGCAYVNLARLNSNGSPITKISYFDGLVYHDLSGVSTSLTIPNLVNKTTYNISLVAYNSGGVSRLSNMVQITPGTPYAPIITNVVPGNKTATIYFTPPAVTNGSAIAQYMYSTGSGGVFTKATGVTSPIVVTGLINATTYNFQLTAINANGSSVPSNTFSGVTPFTVPSVPVIASVTSFFDTTTTSGSVVSFTPPANNGANITQYWYNTSKDATFYKCSGNAVPPLSITGLPLNASYTLKLFAVNSAGNSLVSQASKPITYTYAPPSQVKVTAVTTGYQQLVVLFTPPASNGAEITTYLYSLNGGSYVDSLTSSPPLVINGVLNNVPYNLQVIAVNGAGNSVPSAALAKPVSIVYLPPLAPKIVNIVGSNQSFDVYFNPSVTLGAPVTTYYYSLNGGNTLISANTTSSPFTITGLTNGVSYSVTMLAGSAAGNSPLSAAAVQKPILAVPSAPTVSSIIPGNGRAVIAYTVPLINGSPIIDYRYSINGGNTYISANSISNPLTITGLTNNTTYSMSIAAVNGVGMSPWSKPTSVRPLYTVPSAPVISAVTVGSGSTATVAFTVSAANGGTMGTYLYTYDGGVTLINSNTNTSPITLRYLTKGQSYNIQLVGQNELGNSPLSNSKTFVSS